MNTPAHLILGLACFGRKGRPKVTAAAAAGAILPDLSLYVLAGWALSVQNIAPAVVFGEMYFSQDWQRVFRVDNSFILWGVVFAMAVWAKSPVWSAFAGAGLLHLACDLPLHHDDGRAHFWPLTDWVFQSPVSYWDGRRGAGIIAPAEFLLCLGAVCLTIWRYRSWLISIAMIALLALEFFVVRQWLLFF